MTNIALGQGGVVRDQDSMLLLAACVWGFILMIQTRMRTPTELALRGLGVIIFACSIALAVMDQVFNYIWVAVAILVALGMYLKRREKKCVG